MYSDNKRKALLVLIIVLILGIIGVIIFMLTSNPQGSTATEPVASVPASEKLTAKNTDVKSVKNPIDFDKLWAINPEAKAWLYIPGTNVDYPVLQSMTADDYYLHRDINQEYKYSGSIYMEICNHMDFNDRVTLLYGHNMADGSMFANLHKFEYKDFFDEHKRFYIYTEKHKKTYEIVSAYEYDDRHIMNSFDFSKDKVFKEYLDFISDPRSVNKNVRSKTDHKLTTEDKVVTLSTCLDVGDGRYLLQGVLIKDELTR